MNLPYTDYEAGLLEDLIDPDEASAYLKAALEEGDRAVFLIAIKQIVNARGGLTKVAKDSNLNRVSLQEMLSGESSPRLDSVSKVLKSLGMKLSIAPIEDVRHG